MQSLVTMLAAASRQAVPTAGDRLLGAGHRAPLQAAILTHLADTEGASIGALAAAVGSSRQSVDDCLVERLVPAGLVCRRRRSQLLGGRRVRAWFCQLTPAARQRLEEAP